MRRALLAALGVAATLGVVDATAATAYVYTGPGYVDLQDAAQVPGAYTDAMHVEFRLTFAQPLGAEAVVEFQQGAADALLDAWSAADGRVAFDSRSLEPYDTSIGPPPWVPHFTVGRIETDAAGAIVRWEIEVAQFDFYPEEHPLAATHVFGSFSPGIGAPAPSAIYDYARTGTAGVGAGVFEDAAYTDHAGSWQVVQVLPLPGGAPLLLAALAATGLLTRRARRDA